MTFKIEKNVEIPEKKIHQFPFVEMEVGDSFLFPVEEAGAFMAAKSLHYAAYPDRKMISKKNTEKTHVRVWRTK